MAITYYLSPISLLVQLFNNIGVPLAGGFVYVYQAGTTTPQTTYTDSTGTTANGSPIALSSAGRLQSAGGAPVACWVAQGVSHKMVIEDASSNFILALDNLTALNDPTTLLSLLATVTTGSVLGGADIVANAMRSYDVVASVRAAPAPSLAAGQTLVIDIEGGTLVNDGNGGIFYWNPTTTQIDDGVTSIKPNSISPSASGRYIRQSNLYGTNGTSLLSALGFTTVPTMTITWVQNGNQVTISYPGVSGTSNSTSFSFSGFPIGLRGLANTQYSPLQPAEDNSTGGVSAYWAIPPVTGGNIVISNNAGNWTATGTKALQGGSFSYSAS